MKALTMEEASDLVTSVGMVGMAESGRFTSSELNDAEEAASALRDTYEMHYKSREVLHRSCLCDICRAFEALHRVITDEE